MKNTKGQGIKFKKKEVPLKTIREFLGMTQQEFSNFLGTSRTAISRWENGHREPLLTFFQSKKIIVKLQEKGVNILDIPDFLSKPASYTKNPKS